MGVFGMAAGVAAFPTLTRLIAQDKHSQAYGLLSTAVRRMLVLALGAQVALTCAGPEIAQVIYGERLLEGQPQAIGLALAWMGMGLWAWSAQTIIMRGFYALGKTWIPTLLGSGTVLVCYPLYRILRASMGVSGLAIASAAAISLYVLLLTAMLRENFPGTPDHYGRFFLRAIPATLLGIAAGLSLRPHLPITAPLLRGAILASAGGAVFLLSAALLRLPELREVLSLIERRLPRRLRRS